MKIKIPIGRQFNLFKSKIENLMDNPFEYWTKSPMLSGAYIKGENAYVGALGIYENKIVMKIGYK